MPNNAPLKAIASAAILVLVIGLISRAETQGRSSGSSQSVTAPSADSRGIDSSFFNFNQPSSRAKAPSPTTAPVATTSTVVEPSAPTAPPDIITADSYLVGNLATGEVYFEKDPAAVRPIASISKLFTALIVTRHISDGAPILIASSSVTDSEQPVDVRAGEVYSAHDLLTAMLLVSSNDAATAFADNYASTTGAQPADASRADFVSLMNAAAYSLGLSSTRFQDPSGLSSGNISSADDLFTLARYLYKNQPGILTITKTPEFDIATTTDHGAHDFVNIDPFVYDPHYFGGKTGNTSAAGETMLSLFNLPAQNGTTVPIAIIVLHSNPDERQIDSSILVSRALGVIGGQ